MFWISQLAQIRRPAPFWLMDSPSWIRDRLKARPADLRMLHVEGDSMLPTLSDGDIVLVDLSRTAPTPPGLFVLFDGLGLVAKRLEHVANSDPPRCGSSPTTRSTPPMSARPKRSPSSGEFAGSRERYEWWTPEYQTGLISNWLRRASMRANRI